MPPGKAAATSAGPQDQLRGHPPEVGGRARRIPDHLVPVEEIQEVACLGARQPRGQRVAEAEGAVVPAAARDAPDRQVGPLRERAATSRRTNATSIATPSKRPTRHP
jgi:hypothetical protein